MRLKIYNNPKSKIVVSIVVLSTFAFMAGCAANRGIIAPADAKSSVGLKAEIQKFEDEIWLKGNLDLLDESYAADLVLHKLGESDDTVGLDAYKDAIEGTRSVFPDGRVVIDKVINEGNMRVTQWTFEGIYAGPKAVRWTFWDARTGKSQAVTIPMLLGKKFTVAGCTIARMVDGKIVEMWDYSDDMIGPLQQSGIAFIVEPIEY